MKQFYREMQAWIDAGHPEHEVFSMSTALCATLYLWADPVNYPRKNKEMVLSFCNSERDSNYPFNENGWQGLVEEILSGTVYKNPARLAWIAEHAADD